MAWHYDRKSNSYRHQVLDLPFEMKVYEQSGQRNTVVITCISHDSNGKSGNLTYANSILSAKIQAEEMMDTGRWVEYTPEYLTQPVQQPITRKNVKPKPTVMTPPKPITKVVPTDERLIALVQHFQK